MATQQERFAVIGSNSFSGASFVAHLLGSGVEVVGMSRSPEPDDVFLPYKWAAHDRFRFHQLDLNRDLDRIMAVMDDFRPAYVVNFAAQSMVGQSWEHPEHWFETNVVSTVKLHDRLRQCGFLKKYVHVSTPEVYGSCEGLVKESTAYNPSTPYAVSKAACDMSLMTFLKAYDFPVVFTRAANVYGPGQQLYRIIPRTILYFLTGRNLQLHGGGHSVRSFIHMRDVSEATLRAAREAEPGAIYHLSTTRNIAIRDLVRMIADRLGVDFDSHVEIAGDRLGKDAAYLLDSSRAGAELGWKPEVTLEQGVDDTIEWVRGNLDVLQRQPQEYVHRP